MPDYAELRQSYQRLMGSELGTIYHLLWNECAFVHLKWSEYVALFGSDPTHFEIMNEEAPGFFRAVQDTLWESILLSICRFTDPPRVASRQTLSLSALLRFAPMMPTVSIADLVDTARTKSNFARDWRNRHLAHRDLLLASEQNAEPLMPASRALVREALQGIAETLSAVESYFTGAELWFAVLPGPHWGGEHVLKSLRLATRVRAERHKRLIAGEPLPEDLDWSA